MSRNQELVKNTLIIALGKICTQFVTFFLLPVYTHNLSSAEYGIIDLIITYTGLVAPILSLELERSAFRFLIDARKNPKDQEKILSTIFSTLGLLILFAAILGPIIGATLSLEYWPYILLILITSILTNVALQTARGLGKNIHFSIGSMIIGITNALISIVGILVFHQGIECVLLGHIIANIFGFLYVFFAMKLYQKIKVSRRQRTTLKEMLKFSVPMIPNGISYWVINVSDRALIFAFLGDSANGIYAAATKIPSMIVTLYNIFNMSWMETVSAHSKDHDAEDYISTTANTIIRLFTAVCMCIISILPFIFNLLIGQDFSSSYPYIPVLIIGSFFNIIVGILSSVYIGYKKTKEIAKTTTAAAILNLTINFTLIRNLGLWAAVISTVLSYLFTSFYRLYDLNKSIKIRLNPRLLIFALVALTICTLLYLQKSVLVHILTLLATFAISVFMNRHTLKLVITKYIKKGKT